MFYDIGNWNLDHNQKRFVYEEWWSSENDADQLFTWMFEALSDWREEELPVLFSEVRYVERKYDPSASGYNRHLTLILGLKSSVEYAGMRSTDRFDKDEVKIEIVTDHMCAKLRVTLFEDAEQSMRSLSSLRLYMEDRERRKAA